MQFFEILCIMLGTFSGVTMALLPDPKDPKRPILAVTAFSIVLALAIFFLPVVVNSPRFVITLGLTLLGSGIGFFAMQSLVPQKQPVLDRGPDAPLSGLASQA